MTVSPPTFDRTAFAAVDQTLSATGSGFSRDWLMARFAEGLEIRMLREPLSGFVVFQPGRLAWRPIEGADHAVVVEDMRVAEGAEAAKSHGYLWDSVEHFARFYGYQAILALTGTGEGLIAPANGPARGWACFDESADGTRLIGRVLQGPMALPHLPRDWARRAARAGPGIVIQTTGERVDVVRRADTLEGRLRARGVPVRRECLTTADQARRCATCPTGLYSVLLDGTRIGGLEMDDGATLRAICTALKD